MESHTNESLPNAYQPKPIDTTRVVLPKQVEALTEKLARNAHEVWARGRVEEGWTYGPERNDRLKTHPGLVPYEQLSESEKEYDRNTAMETVKAIVALDYRIELR